MMVTADLRLFLWIILCALPLSAQKWEAAYLFDEDRSSLTLNDFQFSSAQRGIACGQVKENGRERTVSLLTKDGGKTWTLARTREEGLTLFFVDERTGWMVTAKNLWQTLDAGETWRRIKSPKNILRVHFLNAEHGFAIGARAGVWETKNGGERWERVAAVDTVKANPDHTTFTWIAFLNAKSGLITGSNRPPRRSDLALPSWVDPERAESRREVPNLGIVLETRDAGTSWKASATSMFGRITRVRLQSSGDSVGLIEFSETFEYPSEVFRIDWRTGKSARVFRQRDRNINDIWVQPEAAYLGGHEVSGKLSRTPIPGKVRILRSTDYERWSEMEVDYRAVARRVMFAEAGGVLWAATDTGMILRLADPPSPPESTK